MLTGHADVFEQWARVAPWRVALREVETGRMLRYGDLSARAWRLTHGLAARGVVPGDRVALLARNGIETFEMVVACLRLGAAFTPLNWRLAERELGDIIDRCRPRVLITDDASAEVAANLLEARPDWPAWPSGRRCAARTWPTKTCWRRRPIRRSRSRGTPRRRPCCCIRAARPASPRA